MDRERRRYIWSELSHLKWEQALVLYEKCNPGVSYDDLAELTNIPRGTVYRHRDNALHRLRLDVNSLPDDYCLVLYDMAEKISDPDRPNDPPDWSNRWPPTLEEADREVSREQETIELGQTQPSEETSPPVDGPNSGEETQTETPQSESSQEADSVGILERLRTVTLRNTLTALLLLLLLLGLWRVVQFGVWQCNPLTSNFICPFGQEPNGVEEEANPIAIVNSEATVIPTSTLTPTLPPTPDLAQTQAAEATRLAVSAAETGTASVTDTPTNTPTQTDTPTITPTPTETLIPTVTFTPTPLFSDNFDSGSLVIWTPDNGEWVVEEFEPANFQLRCIRPGIIALPTGNNWTNYTVSADVKIISGSGAAGVVARRSSPVDWYDIVIKSEQARMAQNYRVSSQRADWREIQHVGYPEEHGTWYNLRFELVGIQLTMYVDGVKVIEVNHERHVSGTVGLTCGPGTIAVFDNVIVESK